jgi:hypothetical protein
MDRPSAPRILLWLALALAAAPLIASAMSLPKTVGQAHLHATAR